ncbi:molybdopterin-binding protein [Saccharicrinis sp. FJH54]|uniref:TOBE domain-containing protein n=2 Tax=unclassified Saccharicrinis TaxID=2646859 RepID=UPI0035D45529
MQNFNTYGTFFMDGLHKRVGLSDLQMKHYMKLSARNNLAGIIKSIDEGLITSKVVIDLGNGNEIVSIISKDAIDDLQLKVGEPAFAIVKSTEVIIGVPD